MVCVFIGCCTVGLCISLFLIHIFLITKYSIVGEDLALTGNTLLKCYIIYSDVCLYFWLYCVQPLNGMGVLIVKLN